MFASVKIKNELNMKKILHIISSPKGEHSFSIKLGNSIIDKIKQANPGSTIQVKDLTKNPFPHLEEATLAAFYTPAENHTPESKAALQHSDQAQRACGRGSVAARDCGGGAGGSCGERGFAADVVALPFAASRPCATSR